MQKLNSPVWIYFDKKVLAFSRSHKESKYRTLVTWSSILKIAHWILRIAHYALRRKRNVICTFIIYLTFITPAGLHLYPSRNFYSQFGKKFFLLTIKLASNYILIYIFYFFDSVRYFDCMSLRYVCTPVGTLCIRKF